MIINQEGGPVVPDKTIAMFPVISDEGIEPFDLKDISTFLKPLNINHKRDWFTPHFYKCLPLAIGNMQGFVFSLPYTFHVLWNGGNDVNDLSIYFEEEILKYNNKSFIKPVSEFGHGILTIHYPVTLKTPPGINLMTIAPPNFPLPGLSPMTGVIESDNIRFSFTLNIKIDFPNTDFKIQANYPLMGILPIPRNFCDSFELKDSNEIFEKNIIQDEMLIVREHSNARDFANKNNLGQDKLYYSGKDFRKNNFKNHQLPKKI